MDPVFVELLSGLQQEHVIVLHSKINYKKCTNAIFCSIILRIDVSLYRPNSPPFTNSQNTNTACTVFINRITINLKACFHTWISAFTR